MSEKTVFENLFSEYYAGPPVANKKPEYPNEKTTYCAFNDRNRTVGRSEHAMRIVALKDDIKLSDLGLPEKDYTKDIAAVLVERYTPENRDNPTGIRHSFKVPVWARILLMASESLLGFNNSRARVAARIVLDTLEQQQTSRFDLIFKARADTVLAIEFAPTKNTESAFVLFTTVNDMLAAVVDVRAITMWHDANMESVTQTISKASEPVVELDVDDVGLW